MDESIAGGLYGMSSILGKHEKRPDREFVVSLDSMRGFMTINGRAFLGNTPVFRSRVGDRVRWDVMTLGDDFHTFHVHGHRWLRGRRAGRRPHDRAGRELHGDLAGTRARRVVLPLPRGGPHDGRA